MFNDPAVISPGTELSNEQMDSLVAEIDTDKSGTIGLNELHAFLRCYDAGSKKVKRKTALRMTWHDRLAVLGLLNV